ncbi:major head protein [Streptomyces phage Celia]|uniref:Major capsid protein n=1 Tax=Streptomyces phage Celia TaxID=2590946 RepID=A0A516KRE8_9CAUD|nr:major head protein [Streptomyces phage Celia]QDP44213.1 major capsid protein [Streptomyces phage Celia]QJD50575.1 major capsid protein [Streptomyces phage Itza]
MATNEHSVVKPEKIAATAAAALEQQLVLPALFQREGIDQYKGNKDDAINVKVEGVLPFRTYEWRSGSTTSSTPGTRAAIQFDQYTERTIQVTFGGNVYSAVRLTDEQNEFDLPGWAKLMSKQTEAIGRGLEFEAADYLINAPYNVTLGGAVSGRDLRKTLIRAREVMNAFRVPSEARTLVVGTGWESALLSDEKLNLAGNVGEQEAATALREASIGRRFGFDIVVSNELPSDMAVAMVRSAFIFATGAPAVPQSVPFGASASANGVAVRWLRDYDSERFQDRSVVNTYRGFRQVEDVLVGRTSGTDNAFISEHEHFVRAIKLDLDATDDVLPLTSGTGSTEASIELAAITGIGEAGA